MELIGGHDRKPQHLPIGSLKGFGTNPYAEAMWRVVWSESRYYMVGANHVEYDGDPATDKMLKIRQKDPNVTKREVGYKWLPLYPGKPGWVLELWKSPFAFTGCTPEQYEIQYRDPVTGLLTLGPYPTRGEYCQCMTFPTTPTFTQVAEEIGKRRAGWGYTYNDHKAANQEMLEKKEKDKFKVFQDIFKDSQQAFGNRASSVRPNKRTKDKINVSQSAEKLGLSRRGGFSAGTPSDQQPQRRGQNARNR